MKIGMTELLVIFIVALIVIGPDKLPYYAKRLGEALGEFRKVSSSLTGDIKENIVDPLNDATKPLKEAIDPINETTKEINDSLKDITKSINDIGKPAKKVAEAAASVEAAEAAVEVVSEKTEEKADQEEKVEEVTEGAAVTDTNPVEEVKEETSKESQAE